MRWWLTWVVDRWRNDWSSMDFAPQENTRSTKWSWSSISPSSHRISLQKRRLLWIDEAEEKEMISSMTIHIFIVIIIAKWKTFSKCQFSEERPRFISDISKRIKDLLLLTSACLDSSCSNGGRGPLHNSQRSFGRTCNHNLMIAWTPFIPSNRSFPLSFLYCMQSDLPHSPLPISSSHSTSVMSLLLPLNYSHYIMSSALFILHTLSFSLLLCLLSISIDLSSHSDVIWPTAPESRQLVAPGHTILCLGEEARKIMDYGESADRQSKWGSVQ